jgi:hypothetical protein
MNDMDQMRYRAARLFALALTARQDGHNEYFDRLTELANEALAHAEEIERLGGLTLGQ